MSSISILEKIEALPPLPKTIIEVEEFRKKPEKEVIELLQIIEKDALIVSTLLRISNSAMFGFRAKVETPSRAINLLGINFTITIVIGGAVQNLLVSNLEPYGINGDDFMRASNISSVLASNWLANVDVNLKDEMVLPALLQEAGKFILADVISSEGKTEIFQENLNLGKSITDVEKELLEHTTSEVTAKIFKHWKLSENLVNMIEYVDEISKCNEEYKKKTQILEILKIACDVRNPLSEENIQKAVTKVKAYGFDEGKFLKAVEKLQDKLLDEL